jgi:hypothetical protein
MKNKLRIQANVSILVSSTDTNVEGIDMLEGFRQCRVLARNISLE